MLLACVICWQVCACEKADQWPDTPAEVLGITVAAFPPRTDFIAGCEFDAARPDRLRQMMADRIGDTTPDCGFNFSDRIQSIVFGGDYAGDTVVMAIRGIARRDLTTCLAKLDMQPVDEGPLTRVTMKGKPERIGWMSDDVLIVAMGLGSAGEVSFDRALAEERVSGARGLANDWPLLRLLEPRQGAQCTFAATSAARVADLLGAEFTGVSAVFGRLRHVDKPDRDLGVTFDEIDATVGFRFATVAQGEAAARVLPAQIRKSGRDRLPPEALAVLVDMVEITHSAAEVRVRLKVDRPRFEQLGQAMMATGGQTAPR